MAGKPDLSVAQAQNVQNVVVYVSNDNIAQAYAVGHQQHQNGVVYDNTQNTGMSKAYKTKTGEVLENNGTTSYYQIPPNGYKNLINFKSDDDFSGHDGSGSGGAFVTVMGADVGASGGTSVTVFPRCESESSCSSLSSGDGPSEHGQTAIPQTGDVLVYGDGGTVITVPTIVIPLGWKRLITNGVVIYVSPSNAALSSLDQVKDYLLTQGTCKCGLECPLKCDSVFNFDPKVLGKPWTLTADTSIADLTKLCNHKRKLLATLGGPIGGSVVGASAGGIAGVVGGKTPSGSVGLGVVAASPSPTPSGGTPASGVSSAAAMGAVVVDTPHLHNKQQQLLRKDGGIKRKKRKIGGSYSGVSISQLLAQREKMAQQQQQQAVGTTNQPNEQQMWTGVQNSQPVPIQAAFSNRVDGYIDSTSGQLIRYHNQNRPQMMVGNAIIDPNNQIQPDQQVQQHQQMHSNMHNQQILQQQISQQHQIAAHQQNINHQHMQQGQYIQQNIIGPNGQMITVQQPQLNQAQMNMMAQQGLIIQGQQQQRVIMGGGQHTDGLQNDVNKLQHIAQMSNATPAQQEILQRMQQHQHQQQMLGQPMQIGQMRPEDQSKMLQQQRQHFTTVPMVGGTVFNNIRSDGVSQIQAIQQQQPNQMMSNSVVIPQHKTPPWQQNKVNQQNHNMQQNIMQQHQHNQQQMIMANQQQQVHPNIVGNVYDRVPPLHQHMPMSPVWQDEMNRKKNKSNKMNKKHRSYNMIESHGMQKISENVYPNESQRTQIQETSSPSFMEDPSGYLAQQTALLNSTISRQNNGLGFMCHSPQNALSQSSTPPLSNSNKCYTSRSNQMMINHSSAHVETQPQLNTSMCQGCVTGNNQFKQLRHNHQEQREDNPVTSSTNTERYTPQNSSPDTRPIQGGTISTSDKTETYKHQQQPSPCSPLTPTSQQINTPDMYVSVHHLNKNQVDSSLQSNVHYSQEEPVMSSKVVTSQQNKMIDGYCPPPYATGISLDLPVPYQPRTVTTMASGRTFGSNTITSVLAGRAQTATVSVNSPAVVPVLPQLPTVSSNQSEKLEKQMYYQAVPQQMGNMNITKSPLEMVQSVVSSIQVPQGQNQQNNPQLVKHSSSAGLSPGHILVTSGGGQLIVTSNGQQTTMMPPPPPKAVSGMPPVSVSPLVTNVTASVTQVIPNVGVAQQVLGQQTVLVNTLPGQFVLQPSVMTVDGMTVGQNMQLPQIVTGNVIQLDNNEQSRSPPQAFGNRTPTQISPDSGKRKGKKRKMGQQTVASMLHVAAPQQTANFQPQSFSPQGPGHVLQALTIVPGKGGAPPQIVMNSGQPSATNSFAPQQLLTSSQQINLLQPVNLLNNTTGMMQNFPTIQQFIVPGIGGMVMATDSSGNTTLLPETQSVGMQLQLQNVNGQNVLTPVQNNGGTMFSGQGILTAGTAGMVIRTPNVQQAGKLQHSPGTTQFLSPNGGQFVMNGTQFGGQLSPLVASVSPSQQVSVRPAQQQHEIIQCGGQVGQTLMVPTQTVATTSVNSNSQNTTFVQQNTTIVQQQTTMVSNNQQNFSNTQQNNTQNFTVSMNPNLVINDKQQQNINAALLMQRHSVSTQTAAGQSLTPGATTVRSGAGSPPDTTTHSPLAPGADTTTHEGTSPSPPNCTGSRDRQTTHSMAMVHCISSSEPDAADITGEWSRSSSAGSATPKSSDCTDFTIIPSNSHMMHGQVRKSLTPTYVESTMTLHNEATLKPQDPVVSSLKSSKRKHNDTLVVIETRRMHLSQEDDTDADSGSSASPTIFCQGDLVWGPARGCPAWPGKLVDGPTLSDGRVWVRWFGGDKTPTAVHPSSLQTLTQGLDAHHRARKKCRKSRKLNSLLENAIQEAMTELDHMTEKQQDKITTTEQLTEIKANVDTKSSVSPSTKKEITNRLRSGQR